MTAKTEAKPGTVPGRLPEATEDADGLSGAGPSGCRPMRADAVKNRQRILEAAEEVFASEGVSVPIDTVAERACVGVGTLYRHFPTKEALFEAIVMARLEHLLEEAKASADADEPGPALFGFLGEFARHASSKHDLFDALSSAGIDIKSNCAGMIDDMKASIDVLRQRAVSAGAVRSDVSADEIIGLVVGVCQGVGHSDHDDVKLQRMVEIVCDGLKAPRTG